jgi:hypothetical protein
MLIKESRLTSGAVPLFVVLMILLGGCDEDPLAPFQPEVSNQPDSFQLQATGVRNVTLTRDYNWQNNGSTANVNQATTVASGNATLTILDADGTQVYHRDLSENGTYTTSQGSSGNWTIRMKLSRYRGTLNFRAQKP